MAEGDIRRSRRERKKRAGASALEKIKRSRESGLHEEVELEKEEGIFDYVDDREYAKIVQQRQEEGFVLDDDGGYNEHGREIFDEEVAEASKASSSRSKKGTSRQVSKPSGNLKHLLMRGGASEKKKEEDVSVKEDNLLSDILSQYKDSGKSSAKKPKSNSTPKRRSEGLFVPRRTPLQKPSQDHRQEGTGLLKKRVKMFAKPIPPLAPMEVEEQGEELEGVAGDTDMDVAWNDVGDWDVGDDVMCDGEPSNSDVRTTGEVAEKKLEELSVKEEPKVKVPEAAISSSGWETVREGLTTAQEAFSGVQVTSGTLPTQGEGEEEVLRFFWLDAYEDFYHRPGTVFLFGKVFFPEAKAFVSCCVVVTNIERCLYFLPREKVLDQAGRPTEDNVTFQDLYREVNSRYADKYHILRFSSKKVTCKYSFEKAEVPQESEYLQVKYSMDYPAPQKTDSGRTFSHVFGTNTSSLERLILTCGLKGPCWLDVKLPKCPANQMSFCKCEAIVDSMKCITVATEQATPPPLVVMSLSVKITLNPRTGTNEVLALGALVHPEVAIDKPPPDKLFKADLLAIRRPMDRDFPFNFDEFVKQKGFNVEVSPSERAMLGYFLAKLHRLDPDVIVGHNLSSFSLEVLRHRLATCTVPQWSRIGRLKRKELPKGRHIGQLLCAGRPVVDTRISAQELIRAKSYDLTELASSLLHVTHEPMDHEDVLKAFCSSKRLCDVVSHTMDEAMLSLRLMYELNVLPLAYQITCIAGNTLSRTLQGGRAERNEFLLLHAFTARGYICPDKQYGGGGHKKQQEAAAASNDDPEASMAAGKGRGKRKPAYSGGLVLEPKRGFYDRFILLLDFNSLYPSIIQEYNICFTTISHAHCSAAADEEDAFAGLSLPDPSEPLGVLPSEIRVLVERRRQVKKLMKEAQGNKEQYVQYDIRQKALKLTANSMYGCLGFPNSRFYAKPLAALVTSKGREILSHTKDLALKMNLDVIYGDTDSIMINSNTRDLKEAELMAQQVKTEVNKLYKLLEIDIDGIYKAMLLLRKKKYAAVAVEWRDGKMVEKRELKGLDIIRRDWSGLAKRSGHYVLDQILSGAPLDEVIDKVQTFLQALADDVATDVVPMPDFYITKSLTKLPSDYPDKKGQPHVQVALRMQSRGLHVQAGDVIPYIMCKGDSHQPAALRAFHPDEVAKQDDLHVDKTYYLQHQVHAVVARLCEPIQGLEPALLAECLGLDASSYRSAVAGGQEVNDGEEEASEPARDPFEGTEGLFITCHHCRENVEVMGSKCPDIQEGLKCSKCKEQFSVNSVVNHLTLALRKAISKYYDGWLLCDDQSCSSRMRMPTVVLDESYPPCPSCGQGKMKEEYPASALYQQLYAYELLFNVPQADQFYAAKTHVAGYLQKNSYSVIDLASLFPGH